MLFVRANVPDTVGRVNVGVPAVAGATIVAVPVPDPLSSRELSARLPTDASSVASAVAVPSPLYQIIFRVPDVVVLRKYLINELLVPLSTRGSMFNMVPDE